VSSLIGAAKQETLRQINESINTVQAESSSEVPSSKITIHTLGWSEDHAADPGTDPTITLLARVFINGVEVPQLKSVSTTHSSDFNTTTIEIYGPVEIVTHDRESWKQL